MSSSSSTPPTAPSLPLTGVPELLAAGKALGTPINVPGIHPSIVVPAGYTVQPLPFRTEDPLPDHVIQAVEFDDAGSFIAYVKRWKLPQTMLLAQLPGLDGRGGQFKAIFDYHVGGVGEEHKPSRCSHVAVYPCPISEEWKVWSGINGKAQKQKEFIDFIDANAPDVVSPQSAALMEMAMNFESKTDVVFLSKVDRITGGKSLTFKEEVNATGAAGQIKVPEGLALRLPIFEGGKVFEMGARLEWIPRDGKLTVTVHLKRVSDVVRSALADIREEIAAGTEIMVLNGSAGK